MSNTLKIALTEAQKEFIELRCSYPAFFAGLGTGKSYVSGLKAFIGAGHSPKAVVGVYAPTHELLRDVSIPSVEFWLQRFGLVPNKDYVLNKTEHTIKTNVPNMGNFMFKSYQDVKLLIGYETSMALVDEIDTLSLDKAEEAWDAIVSRNRLNLQNVSRDLQKWSELNKRWEYINQTCATTSPEGFKFCYNRWKKDVPPGYECVHGTARDNPALTEDYIESRCKGKTKEWVASRIDGQFANLTTGTIYYNFSRESHDSTEMYREGETVYIGCDFNVGKTAFSTYVRRDGGRVWHIVDEGFNILDTPEMISIINSRYVKLGSRVIMYPDSSGAARHGTNAHTSHIAQLKNSGLEVKAKSKNPHVVDRIEAMNSALSDRLVLINVDNCPETVRCLEQQCYKKNGEPDKDSGNDHQNDATTYPIAYEMPIKKSMFKINYSFAQRGSY